MRINYGQIKFGQEEINSVNKALEGNLAMGSNVELLEKKISELFCKKYGLMVNSGSSANYLAIESLDLPKGSEVITPVLTFSTTVAPLIRNNLKPVFVDVKESNFNIDVDKIEEKITSKTKALMIPNLLGNIPDWLKIKKIAEKHDLISIEDSADTVGATINDVSTGNYSDISTTSFYGSHIITCGGNGGMVCVNNNEIKKRISLLRGWGRSSATFGESEGLESRFVSKIDNIEYDAKFVFEDFGYNHLPSEIGAAFGIEQVKKLNHNISFRESVFKRHIDFFKEWKDYIILPDQLENSRVAWLAFPIIVKRSSPFTRKQVQIFLEQNDIQTRPIFTGNILRQPCFAKDTYRKYTDIVVDQKADSFINADNVMQGGVLLPCHNALTENQIEYLYETLSKFLKKYQ